MTTTSKVVGKRRALDVISSHELPDSLAELVMDVVKRARLWRGERADVAAELCSHFRDGLDAGTSVEQLRGAFGNPKLAARLIRRAKKRQRPLAWRMLVRTVQATAAIAGLIVLAIGLLVGRMFVGSPVVSVDYLAKFNEPAVGHAHDEVAWPVYRDAMMAIKPSIPTNPIFTGDGGAPGTEKWDDAVTWLQEIQPVLDSVRHGSQRAHLGFVISDSLSPEDQKLWPDLIQAPFAEDPIWRGSLFSILLPHLAEMRHLSRTVGADVYRAAEEDEGEIVMQDLETLLALSQHCRELKVLINDLVSMAIFEVGKDRLLWVLEHHPNCLSAEQLRELAHRFAAITDDKLVPRLDGERMGFYDTIQRTYTDNGSGDGHLTWDGLKGFGAIVTFHDGNVWRTPSDALLVPAIGMSRRDVLQQYDDYMDRMERMAHVPLWERDRPRANPDVMTEIEVAAGSPVTRARMLPLVLLLPALDKAIISGRMAVFSRDVATTALALESYRRDHGGYPATLAALVPSYLPDVPRDVFDGKPLRYFLRDGKPLLYSIGTDRDDDGGRAPVSMDGRVAPQNVHQWIPRDQALRPAYVGVTPTTFGNSIADGDWVLFPHPDATE